MSHKLSTKEKEKTYKNEPLTQEQEQEISTLFEKPKVDREITLPGIMNFLQEQDLSLISSCRLYDGSHIIMICIDKKKKNILGMEI